MPNAIKMLQDDHNSVRILCRQLPSLQAGTQGDEQKAARQLVSMLETHATIEEELVYPVLASAHPDLIARAEADHEVADGILAEIAELPAGIELREAVARLQDVLDRHVAEEEASVFPLLTDALGLSGLEDLGRQMALRQQELMAEAEDTTGAGATARTQNLSPRI